jgi:hypothetical protein
MLDYAKSELGLVLAGKYHTVLAGFIAP